MKTSKTPYNKPAATSDSHTRSWTSNWQRDTDVQQRNSHHLSQGISTTITPAHVGSMPAQTRTPVVNTESHSIGPNTDKNVINTSTLSNFSGYQRKRPTAPTLGTLGGRIQVSHKFLWIVLFFHILCFHNIQVIVTLKVSEFTQYSMLKYVSCCFQMSKYYWGFGNSSTEFKWLLLMLCSNVMLMFYSKGFIEIFRPLQWLF